MIINPRRAVIVWQNVPSSAIKELRLRSDRSVTIEWQSGHYSTHYNVRKRDMLRLLTLNYNTFGRVAYFQLPSVGQWVNTYVL